MGRDWYIVYTSNRKEKKVVTSLTQKKIKNYFPLNNVRPPESLNQQVVEKALFKSYVFVCISAAEFNLVKQIPGVINFLYWLDKPAIIQKEEIEAIQLITAAYSNISVEKSGVNLQNEVIIIEDTVLSNKGDSVKKNINTLTVILPTLGYTLKAEREPDKALVLDVEMQESVDTFKNMRAYLK